MNEKNIVDSKGFEIAQRVLCEVLDLEFIPLSKVEYSLYEIGLDSEKNNTVLTMIEDAVGSDITVDPLLLFNYPTVSSLALYLDELLTSKPTVNTPFSATQSVHKISMQSNVAVIGSCCRFPGHVDDCSGLKNLVKVCVAVGDYAADSRELIGKPEWKIIGGFVDDIAFFDNDFFRISAREAVLMDPKQRLLLENSYNALANAGLSLQKVVHKSCGIFIGAWSNDYASLLSMGETDSHVLEVTGQSEAVAAGRLAYFYDCNGPTLTIDTACSSSAVVVHIAKKFLIDAEVDFAICGAANICIGSQIFNAFMRNKLLSPAGSCKAFDLNADGYVRSEAVTVLICQLINEQSDNELGVPPFAIIRGSAINQDGHSAGLLAPNKNSQVSVISICFHECELIVDSIECHGTGTQVGDRIELMSIIDSNYMEMGSLLSIHSVKTVIGHTEACSGMAGMLQVALSYGSVTPHMHNSCFHKLNTQNSIAMPYVESLSDKFCSGINSFGISGTNVHLILESNVSKFSTLNFLHFKSGMFMLPVTAKTIISIQSISSAAATMLQKGSIFASDLCKMFQQSCELFKHRLWAGGNTSMKLMQNIMSNSSKLQPAEISQKFTLLYTGRGSAYQNMGSELTLSCPTFSYAVSNCLEYFGSDLLFEDGHFLLMISRNNPTCKYSYLTTSLSVFVLQYALTQMWSDQYNIISQVVVGHSFGEYAAALTASIFSLSDACRLVSARERTMEQFVNHGYMVACHCDSNTIASVINVAYKNVCIGCYNSRNQTVISGSKVGIEKVSRVLQWLGFRLHNVGYVPSHSPIMADAARSLFLVANDVQYRIAQTHFVSSTLGTELTTMNGNYWLEHLVKPVNFMKAIEFITMFGSNMLLEIGPDPILLNIASSMVPNGKFMASLNHREQNSYTICKSLDTLFCSGLPMKFGSHPNINFPSFLKYNFDSKYFWCLPAQKKTISSSFISPQERVPDSSKQKSIHPLLGTRIDLAPQQNGSICFVNNLCLFQKNIEYLLDHIIGDDTLCPATVFIELILAAVKQVSKLKSLSYELHDFIVMNPLHFDKSINVEVQTWCESVSDHKFMLHIYSRMGTSCPWAHHVQSVVQISDTDFGNVAMKTDFQHFSELKYLDNKDAYKILHSIEMCYGPEFQAIQTITYDDHKLLAHVCHSANDSEMYIIHPALLDGIFQSVIFANILQLSINQAHVFFRMKFFKFYYHPENINREFFVRVFYSNDQKRFGGNCIAYDGNDSVVMQVIDFLAVTGSEKENKGDMNDYSYIVAWKSWHCPTLEDEFPNIKHQHIFDTGGNLSKLLQRYLSLRGILDKFNLHESHSIFVPCDSMLPILLILYKFVIYTGNLANIDKVNILLLFCAKQCMSTTRVDVNHTILVCFLRTLSLENKFICAGSVIIDGEEEAFARFFSVLPNAFDLVANEEVFICKHATYRLRILRHSECLCSNTYHVPKPKLSPDLTYIAGGTHGIGLKVSQCIVINFKGIAELCGHRPPSFECQLSLDLMRSSAKVACESELNLQHKRKTQHLFASFGLFLGTCKVYHSAGLLKDKLIGGLTCEIVKNVFQPKCSGAMNIHLNSSFMRQTSLILFSSVLGVLGNPGQSHYGSANGFLDSFANKLLQFGHPSVSIAWGAWSDIGLVSHLNSVLSSYGLLSFGWQIGIEYLSFVGSDVDTNSNVIFLSADWDKFVKIFPMNLSLCSSLLTTGRQIFVHHESHDVASKDKSEKLMSSNEFEIASSSSSLISGIVEVVEKCLRQILSINPDDVIPSNIPFMDLGMDSLSSVEFSDSLQALVGDSLTISPTIAFDYGNMDLLCSFLHMQLKPRSTNTVHCEEVEENRMHTNVGTTECKCIAIISMAHSLPKTSSDGMSLWPVLLNIEDCMSPIPCSRWNVSHYYYSIPGTYGKMYINQAGFLVKDISLFDAVFFGISKKEAINTDPQIRILLETSYHAYENIKTKEHTFGIDTNIFVGSMDNEYSDEIQKSQESCTAVGINPSALSGRLAYFYGTQGSAITINTACSSSLVALEQSVLNCDHLHRFSIVAGVCLMISPVGMIMRCLARMLSPDSHCKTFDIRADGFARGEGVCVVITKLIDAECHDKLAVVKAISTNQDGHSSGLTAPNAIAQQNLIMKTLHKANNSMKSVQIGLVETHGTGTSLGDAIEINSLRSVFLRHEMALNDIAITSVKVNLGHTEGAAGLSGLSKMLYCFNERYYCAHRNWSIINDKFCFDNGPFTIPMEGCQWQSNRYGTVSSFGATGTNAFAVVGDKQVPLAAAAVMYSSYIFPVSGKTNKSLAKLVAKWHQYLNDCTTSINLRRCMDILCMGRQHFLHRFCFHGNTFDNVAEDMVSFDHVTKHTVTRHNKSVIFLYTGHGSEYLTMSNQLSSESNWLKIESESMSSNSQLSKLKDFSILGVESMHAAGAVIEQVQFSQQFLCIMQYSLSKMWELFGIQADYVLGHSAGEISAMTTSGILSFSDAMQLARLRGGIIQNSAHGTMSAIRTDLRSIAQIVSQLPYRAGIASINSCNQIVLSASVADTINIHHLFTELNIHVQLVQKGFGSHCFLMNKSSERLCSAIESFSFNLPRIDVFSPMDGHRVTKMSAEYWRIQLNHCVNFSLAIRSLPQVNACVEVGPHPVLLSFAKQRYSSVETMCPSLNKFKSDIAIIFNSICRLYESGHSLNWNTICTGYIDTVDIWYPNYCFDQASCWFNIGTTENPIFFDKIESHPLLGQQICMENAGQRYNEWIFENTLDLADSKMSYLLDHNVSGDSIFPAAAFIEMMLGAMKQIKFPNVQRIMFYLKDLIFISTLKLDMCNCVTMQTICKEIQNGNLNFSIHSIVQRYDTTWKLHAQAIANGNDKLLLDDQYALLPTSKYLQRLDHISIYKFFHDSGMLYGPAFQTVSQMLCNDDHICCSVSTPQETRDKYILHPTMLDGILQTSAVVNRVQDVKMPPSVVFRISEFMYAYDTHDPVSSASVITKRHEKIDSHSVECLVYSSKSSLSVMQISGIHSKEMKFDNTADTSMVSYKLAWVQTYYNVDQNLNIDTSPNIICVNRLTNYEFVRHLQFLQAGPACWNLVLVHTLGANFFKRNAIENENILVVNEFKSSILVLLLREVKNLIVNNLLVNMILLQGGRVGLKWHDILTNFPHTCAAAFLKALSQEKPGFKTHKVAMFTKDFDAIITFINNLRLNEDIATEVIFFSPKIMYSLKMISFSNCIDWKDNNIDLFHSLNSIKNGFQESAILSGGTTGIAFEIVKKKLSFDKACISLICRRKSTQSCRVGLDMLRHEMKPVYMANNNVSDLFGTSNIFSHGFPGHFLDIFHTAALLHDKMVVNLLFNDMSSVIDAKCRGALSLYFASIHRFHSSFCLFSSVASIFGSRGQSNYCAANSFLDFMSCFMIDNGHNSLSISWGNWASVGMALSENSNLEKYGFMALPVNMGLQCLGEAKNVSSTISHVAFVSADWNVIVKHYKSVTGLLSHLLNPSPGMIESINQKNFTASRSWELDVNSSVRRILKKILSINSEDLDPMESFMDLGMDSLASVEFSRTLQSEFGELLTVSPTIAFDYPNLFSITSFFESKIKQLVEPKKTISQTVKPMTLQHAGEPNISWNQQSMALWIADDNLQNNVLSHFDSKTVSVAAMSFYLPQYSYNGESVWECLSHGVDCVTSVPLSRWDMKAYYNSKPGEIGKMYVKKAAFLNRDISLFDHLFFNISPKESALTDPQLRLLLNTSWNAVENCAGLMNKIANSMTSVYVGCMDTEYNTEVQAFRAESHGSIGLNTGSLSGQLAYFYGTHGTAMTLNTACSSALVGLYHAVHEIQRQDDSSKDYYSMVSGVSLMISPQGMISRCSLRMLSPDEHCKTFDVHADGYARGEGICTLIVQSGTNSPSEIVIKGIQTNQDGKSSGLTAPNPLAQQSLIQQLLQHTINLNKPENTQHMRFTMLETHGTGTSLGDTIEVNSLSQILSHFSASLNKIPIGTVKTNMGHTESTAGAAGFVKLIASLTNNYVTKHRNWSIPNKRIDFLNNNFVIPLEGYVLEGGENSTVSSFGATGTNAFAILETHSCVIPQFAAIPKSQYLLPFSAKSAKSLQYLIEAFLLYLSTNSALESIHDCMHVLCNQRSTFRQRLCYLDTEILTYLNNTHCDIEWKPMHKTLSVPEPNGKTAFLFTGHGAEYFSMAKQATNEIDAFGKEFGAVIDGNQQTASCSCSSSYAFNKENFSATSHILNQMKQCEPFLFELQYSLSSFWMRFGFMPDLIAGHSAGEIAGVTLAGMISVRDANRLAMLRGKLLDSAEKGVMIATELPDMHAADLFLYLPYRTGVASINTPHQVVLSLHAIDMDACCSMLNELNMQCKIVQRNCGSHCFLMNAVAATIPAIFEQFTYQPPAVTFYSSVNGERLDAMTNSYWKNQLTKCVNFHRTLSTIPFCRSFLEIGPHPVLIGFAKQKSKKPSLFCNSLNKYKTDLASIYETVVRLFENGYDFKWNEICAVKQQTIISACSYPNYHFDEHRCWFAQKLAGAVPSVLPSMQQEHPLPIASAEPIVAPATQLRQSELDLYSYVLTWTRVSTVDVCNQPYSFIFNTYRIIGNKMSQCNMVNTLLNAALNRSMQSNCIMIDSQKMQPSCLIIWSGSIRGPLTSLLHLFAEAKQLSQTKNILHIFSLCQMGYMSSHHSDVIGNLNFTSTSSFLKSWSYERANTVLGLAILRSPVMISISRFVEHVLKQKPKLNNSLLIDSQNIYELKMLKVNDCNIGQNILVDPTRNTTLISGGFTGVGFQCSKHVAFKESGCLLMFGRRMPWKNVLILIDLMRYHLKAAQGIILNLDFNSDMRNVFEHFQYQSIIKTLHSAAIVIDISIHNMRLPTIYAVLKSKCKGGLHMYLSTSAQCNLSLTLFSSVSSVFGNRGQSHYAAANAALDYMACSFTQHGHNVQSISWGNWSVGIAVHLNKSFEQYGLEPINELEGTSFLSSVERLVFITHLVFIKAKWHIMMEKNPLIRCLVDLLVNKDADKDGICAESYSAIKAPSTIISHGKKSKIIRNQMGFFEENYMDHVAKENSFKLHRIINLGNLIQLLHKQLMQIATDQCAQLKFMDVVISNPILPSIQNPISLNSNIMENGLNCYKAKVFVVDNLQVSVPLLSCEIILVPEMKVKAQLNLVDFHTLHINSSEQIYSTLEKKGLVSSNMTIKSLNYNKTRDSMIAKLDAGNVAMLIDSITEVYNFMSEDDSLLYPSYISEAVIQKEVNFSLCYIKMSENCIEDIYAKFNAKIDACFNMKHVEFCKLSKKEKRNDALSAENLAPLVMDVSEIVSRAVRDTLHLNRDQLLENNAPLVALGFDSLSMLELANFLNDNLSTNLNISDLYEYDTVAKLASNIEQQIFNKHGSQHVHCKPLETETSQGGKLRKGKEPEVTSMQIKSIDKLGKLPLSFNQLQMWFLFQYETWSLHNYNEHVIISLENKFVNFESISHAFNQIIQLNTSLRSKFIDSKEAYQQICSLSEAFHKTSFCFIQMNELSKKVDISFQLNTQIPLRCNISIGSEWGLLSITQHHIITDAWSIELMMKDILQFHNDLQSNVKSIRFHRKPKLHYADFSAAQLEYMNTEQIKNQLFYWKEQLKNHVEINFPLDKERPVFMSCRGNTIHTSSISTSFCQKADILAKRLNCTLFCLTMTAFTITLAKFACQFDILFGTFVSARNSSKLESIMGYFINTLPVMFHLSSTMSLNEAIIAMKNCLQLIYANQDVPFSQIVDNVVVSERPSNRPVLLQIMFNYLNFSISQERTEILPNLLTKIAKFDFTFTLYAKSGLFVGADTQYATDLFFHSTLLSVISQFSQIIKHMHSLQDPNIFLTDLNLISITKVLSFCCINKNITRNFIGDFCLGCGRFILKNQLSMCLPKLFLKNQKIINGCMQTLRTTENYAKAVCLHMEHTVGMRALADQSVVVKMDKTLTCVLSYYCAIEAGLSFLTILPDFPIERQGMISANVSAVITLSKSSYSKGAHSLLLPSKHAYATNTNYDLLYVIFTSGSTGVPKGIAVKHQNVVNWLFSLVPLCMANLDSVVAQSLGFVFDLGIADILLSNATGAVLHISENYVEPINALKQSKASIARIAVTFVNQAHHNKLIRFKMLEFLYHGGESVQKFATDFICCHSIDELNEYGPAEATIEVTAKRVRYGDFSTNVGHALLNSFVDINSFVDGSHVPIGVPAELIISGTSVSRGYFGNIQTAKCNFISTVKHTEHEMKFGSLSYKTGDIAKQCNDGSFCIYGRKDFQVKLYGQRIELQEIEDALLHHNAIKQVVAMLVETSDADKQIVAFIVKEHQTDYDYASLRATLRTRLPAIMIPSNIINIDEIPANVSGKTDRTELKRMFVEEVQNKSTRICDNAQNSARLDGVKGEIFQIWTGILGHSSFNSSKSFFEIGGNSMLALRVTEEMRVKVSGKIKVIDILENPTIDQLAHHLNAKLTQSTDVDKSIFNASQTIFKSIDSVQSNIFDNGVDAPEVAKFFDHVKKMQPNMLGKITLQDIFLFQRIESIIKYIITGPELLPQLKYPSILVPIKVKTSSLTVVFFEHFVDEGYLQCFLLVHNLLNNLNRFSCHNADWFRMVQLKHQKVLHRNLTEDQTFAVTKVLDGRDMKCFCGHSVGGLLAYESALRLEQQIGLRGYVILIDSSLEFVGGKVQNRIEHYITLKKLAPLLPWASMTVDKVKRIWTIMKLFAPRTIMQTQQQVFLFRTPSRDKGFSIEWNKRCRDKVLSVSSVNGDHLEMVQNKYNHMLCMKINAILAEHITCDH